MCIRDRIRGERLVYKSIFGRLFWAYSIILVLVLATLFGAMSGFYVHYIADQQFNEAQKASGLSLIHI